jgi:hypothetical protein
LAYFTTQRQNPNEYERNGNKVGITFEVLKLKQQFSIKIKAFIHTTDQTSPTHKQ